MLAYYLRLEELLLKVSRRPYFIVSYFHIFRNDYEFVVVIICSVNDSYADAFECLEGDI
jgi:hypothetical protein